MKQIFVFGANALGIHGAGAALEACTKWGAVPGVGEGRTGNAYAIPTKLKPTAAKRQLPLSDIQTSVTHFLAYANAHPKLEFLVTRIGCGLAGYKDAEIAPMFNGAPLNVKLPIEWKGIVQV